MATSSSLTVVPSATITATSTQKPDQIHLAWVNDPATTLTVVWRTYSTSTPSTVEYRAVGETSWKTATGALRPSGTTGTLHEVTLTSLKPSTEYEYRVRGDNSIWSDVYQTRTAPTLGPADFSAIYFADTGLIGRADGLTDGTQQIINEIDKLDPLLLLGGGDYAYYNTDKRFGTLENTIDEWFNQWQPVLSESPIMPTYGNHEIRLEEKFQNWANRFPTPNGFDNRRNYSFDVGDVHFVSILSQEEQKGLSTGQLNWIEQDILAAQSRGQRWIIPYMHAGPFGDGKNHPSNRAVRAQLGPLFEKLDVDLVIYSHDQAYERTYPLINVPSTNSRTSSSLTDYTKEDGVIYVKTSPAGKRSNKNNGFSQFSTSTIPNFMAVRDNTQHHFSRLIVSDEGSIRLDTYGVLGNGAPPIIIDSFQITDDSNSIAVSISDATATEGANNFLVFDLKLSKTSNEVIILNLSAVDGTAKGGLLANFGHDLTSQPIDFANQEFEVSTDGGISWQAAVAGTQVTFAVGQTQTKVRLAVNNDRLDEPETPETMVLKVANVISGQVNRITDTGMGAIIDNDTDRYRFEAESLTNKSVYRTENISAASGGKALSLNGGASNEIGSASFNFTGVDGLYNIVVGTFDEADGLARFEMTQNNANVGSITLDEQRGSGSAIAQTFVTRAIATSLEIKSGDMLKITGFENSKEHARLDYIDFVPVNPG